MRSGPFAAGAFLVVVEGRPISPPHLATRPRLAGGASFLGAGNARRLCAKESKPVLNEIRTYLREANLRDVRIAGTATLARNFSSPKF